MGLKCNQFCIFSLVHCYENQIFVDYFCFLFVCYFSTDHISTVLHPVGTTYH